MLKKEKGRGDVSHTIRTNKEDEEKEKVIIDVNGLPFPPPPV